MKSQYFKIKQQATSDQVIISYSIYDENNILYPFNFIKLDLTNSDEKNISILDTIKKFYGKYFIDFNDNIDNIK